MLFRIAKVSADHGIYYHCIYYVINQIVFINFYSFSGVLAAIFLYVALRCSAMLSICLHFFFFCILFFQTVEIHIFL